MKEEYLEIIKQIGEPRRRFNQDDRAAEAMSFLTEGYIDKI